MDHADRADGVLYSARTSSEYAELEQELDALRILRNDRAGADAATSAIRELAARADGYHRVPPSDALIAATAAERGGLAVFQETCTSTGSPRSSVPKRPPPRR